MNYGVVESWYNYVGKTNDRMHSMDVERAYACVNSNTIPLHFGNDFGEVGVRQLIWYLYIEGKTFSSSLSILMFAYACARVLVLV